MAHRSPTYAPRHAAAGVVFQVVRDHFETFRARASTMRAGEGLPRFVEQAAFARSATACHAEALAEAGVPRVPGVRVAGGGLRALPLW
jgi:hypothetical protein